MDATESMRQLGGLWYVATPYTKYAAGREAAFHEACRVTARLLESGVKAYSPIAHTHPVAQYTTTCETDHEFWLDVDRPMMDAASGICVVTMPGWDESRGVEFEIREFERMGKPIVLLEWRNHVE